MRNPPAADGGCQRVGKKLMPVGRTVRIEERLCIFHRRHRFHTSPASRIRGRTSTAISSATASASRDASMMTKRCL